MTEKVAESNGTQFWIPQKWILLAVKLLFLGLLLLLVASFAEWVTVVSGAVVYPDQIDYGEGIIWQQTELILDGLGYKDIGTFPHIVFHYPPVFHLMSGLLMKALGTDQLVAGRLVTALSTFGICVLIGLLTYHGIPGTERKAVRAMSAGIAALIPLSFLPVAVWSLTDRVDMLAIAFTLLGSYFALRAVDHGSNALVAAVFFVLAVFTKQTMIVAPIAAFAVLILVRPRAAWLGAAAGIILGVAAFLVLQEMTNGGFLEHVLGYNINRLQFSNIFLIVIALAPYPFFIALAIIAAVHIITRLRDESTAAGWLADIRQSLRGNRVRQVEVFAMLYFVLATIALAAMLKSGANFNYTIEWISVCSILVGLFLRKPIATAFASDLKFISAEQSTAAHAIMKVLIPSFLIFQVYNSHESFALKNFADAPAPVEFQKLTDMIRKSTKPVISDNMVAVMKAGKQVYLETAIIAELTAMEKWHEAEFIRKINNQDFAFFVYGDSQFTDRFSPAARQAIETQYPRREELAGHVLRFP